MEEKTKELLETINFPGEYFSSFFHTTLKKVKVSRDFNKSCLTLITCTKNSKTEQTVYILERTSKVKDGDN